MYTSTTSVMSTRTIYCAKPSACCNNIAIFITNVASLYAIFLAHIMYRFHLCVHACSMHVIFGWIWNVFHTVPIWHNLTCINHMHYILWQILIFLILLYMMITIIVLCATIPCLSSPFSYNNCNVMLNKSIHSACIIGLVPHILVMDTCIRIW